MEGPATNSSIYMYRHTCMYTRRLCVLFVRLSAAHGPFEHLSYTGDMLMKGVELNRMANLVDRLEHLYGLQG